MVSAIHQAKEKLKARSVKFDVVSQNKKGEVSKGKHMKVCRSKDLEKAEF